MAQDHQHGSFPVHRSRRMFWRVIVVLGSKKIVCGMQKGDIQLIQLIKYLFHLVSALCDKSLTFRTIRFTQLA